MASLVHCCRWRALGAPLYHLRYIQKFATHHKAKPTDKIIYGVEDGTDDPHLHTKEVQEEVSADTEGNPTSHQTVSNAGFVATLRCSSQSQKQAALVDSTAPYTPPVNGSSEKVDIAVMRRGGSSEKAIDITAMQPRNKSADEHMTSQDVQFPNLKLNQRAPNFYALSSHGPIELYEYISTPPESHTANAPGRGATAGSWVVFFSHPMDYTPVCTTEVASMAGLQGEFAKRGAKLLGLSIGSVEQHRDWMREIREINKAGRARRGGPLAAAKSATVGLPGTIHLVSGGGRLVSGGATISARGLGSLDEETEMGIADRVGSGSKRMEKRARPTPEREDEQSLLNFPIIADENGFVSQLYGMLEDAGAATEVDPSTGERRIDHLQTVRSLFIIDPHRRIRVMTAYPYTTGGNTAEILRTLDALQKTDQAGVFTPEGWNAGDEVVIPPEMTHEDAEKKFGKGMVRHVTSYLRYVHHH